LNIFIGFQNYTLSAVKRTRVIQRIVTFLWKKRMPTFLIISLEIWFKGFILARFKDFPYYFQIYRDI